MRPKGIIHWNSCKITLLELSTNDFFKSNVFIEEINKINNIYKLFTWLEFKIFQNGETWKKEQMQNIIQSFVTSCWIVEYVSIFTLNEFISLSLSLSLSLSFTSHKAVHVYRYNIVICILIRRMLNDNFANTKKVYQEIAKWATYYRTTWK